MWPAAMLFLALRLAMVALPASSDDGDATAAAAVTTATGK
jgi:hypothetical protein